MNEHHRFEGTASPFGFSVRCEPTHAPRQSIGELGPDTFSHANTGSLGERDRLSETVMVLNGEDRIFNRNRAGVAETQRRPRTRA